MVETELHLLTEQLLIYTERLLAQFKYTKESKVRADFSSVVKPFADEVKNVNDRWFVEAKKYIDKRKPKYIHLKQIESAHEQIELLSVQAFYPETSRTRFLNYWNSVRYLLIELLDQK